MRAPRWTSGIQDGCCWCWWWCRCLLWAVSQDQAKPLTAEPCLRGRLVSEGPLAAAALAGAAAVHVSLALLCRHTIPRQEETPRGGPRAWFRRLLHLLEGQLHRLGGGIPRHILLGDLHRLAQQQERWGLKLQWAWAWWGGPLGPQQLEMWPLRAKQSQV